MSALCIATRGVICSGGGGSVEVVVDVSPVVAAQHLRPLTVADNPVLATAQGSPVVSSREIRPIMRDADGPTSTSQRVPDILSTDELRPVMRKVET